MDDADAGRPPPTVALMINSWQATLMLGLVTIVFGVIITSHPNGSLRRNRLGDLSPDPGG
jgi:hypothetical protein